MKDGVEGSEGIGELKGEGVCTGLGDNVVGTQVVFRELLQGTGGLEVFSFDKYFITNFEIWCWRSVVVSSDLVSLLMSIGDC